MILSTFEQLSILGQKLEPRPVRENAPSTSNLEILERFQSKVLRIITDAPWYIPNVVLKSDLQIPTVQHEATKYSARYRK
jgi:hypothetical protein